MTTTTPEPAEITGWQLALLMALNLQGIAIGWLIWGAGHELVVGDLWMDVANMLFGVGSWIALKNLWTRAFPPQGPRPYAGGPFLWFFLGYHPILLHVLPAVEGATHLPIWSLNLLLLGSFVAWMIWRVFRSIDTRST